MKLRSSSGTKRFPINAFVVSCFLILFSSCWFNAIFYPELAVPPILAATDCSKSASQRSTVGAEFSLAFDESLGFFDDISDADWTLLKQKSVDMYKDGGNPRGDGVSYVPSNFYQTYYEPDFSCRHERRIGKIGDGGKWVCDPHRLFRNKTANCLVYSVGSEGDFSFENSVRASIGSHCEIHTFDFGNYSAAASKLNHVTNYHQWGLSSISHTDSRGNIYKTIDQTVRDLHHEGRTIDIFKIDCEGCEWATVKSWMGANVVLRQILVELHQVQVPGTMEFFELLHDNNYVVFHKEPNIQYWQIGGGAIEYSFLKLGEGYRRV